MFSINYSLWMLLKNIQTTHFVSDWIQHVKICNVVQTAPLFTIQGDTNTNTLAFPNIVLVIRISEL